MNKVSPRESSRDLEPTAFSISDITDVLWTLSDRCNLQCTYCRVVPHGNQKPHEPTRMQVDRILEQLFQLPALESLIISGGEALISCHLDHVLDITKALAPVRYVITNGTTLTPKTMDILLKHDSRIMVTVDAMDETTNALTRGYGVLRKSIRTLSWLLERGVFTIAIIVLTRYNIGTILATLQGLYGLGVRNILIQQLHCADRTLRQFFLDASPKVDQIAQLFDDLNKFKMSYPDAVLDDNEICFFHHRVRLHAEKCDEAKCYLPARLFQCGAGFKFFAIKANGDVIPCNAMLDCVVGNLHEQNIETILTRSADMVSLRNLRHYRVDVIPGCADCRLNPICDGGCRADVYNLTGEIGDPHLYCPWNKTSSVSVDAPTSHADRSAHN